MARVTTSRTREDIVKRERRGETSQSTIVNRYSCRYLLSVPPIQHTEEDKEKSEPKRTSQRKRKMAQMGQEKTSSSRSSGRKRRDVHHSQFQDCKMMTKPTCIKLFSPLPQYLCQNKETVLFTYRQNHTLIPYLLSSLIKRTVFAILLQTGGDLAVGETIVGVDFEVVQNHLG